MKNYESQNNKDSSSEEQHYNDGAISGATILEFPLFQGSSKLEKCRNWGKCISSLPEEQHKQWLNQGNYSGGAIILCGLACYRKDRENLVASRHLQAKRNR